LQKVDKRIAIAFIHADWCGYCQAMKQTTFKAKEVIKMLDVHYWFIQLNAEEKSRIRFKGNTYGFKPTGNNIGTHGLAAEFASLDGRISYPMICFLDPNHKVILRYGQFISGDDLLKLLEEMKRIYN